MAELLLLRDYYDQGTNGKLYLNGIFICCTIELPWKNNLQNISCIAEGAYPIAFRTSEKFGTHIIIHQVRGRDKILIHPANFAILELRGCIAPVIRTTSPGCGIHSRKAMQLLIQALKQNDMISKQHFLIIKKNNQYV